MSSVKSWRRTALTAYLAAGVALPLAGYTLATTQTNINAIAVAEQRLDAVWRTDVRNSQNQENAATAAGEGENLDSRPYSPDVNWAAVSERVMPSVVIVSVIKPARGDASHNRAWLIPGVQANHATIWFTRYRAWEADWEARDKEREWATAGAGFLIGDGNQVATAGHVISGAGGVRINLANGDWRSAEVAAVDLAQDVAVLRIEGAPGQPVAIAPAMPRQGHAVATIGAPQGWGFSLSAGVVSRYGTAPGTFATLPMLQIAVPVSSGNSGGVVINAKGEAVGLVSFGQPAFNQAVPIGRVLDVAAGERRRYSRSL